ncbi:MAG: hypothetical protein K2L96_01725 [Muribaculaceae bacterium]|nr:hypothetical protein [Muribaculaceae bacterium]
MYKTETMRRNDAYIAAFERLLDTEGGAGTYEELRELSARVLEMRPPRYFVSQQRAQDVYKAHRCGHKLRPGLWEEFCEEVDRELNARPWLKAERAINFVLCFKRPSRYYMSRETAWRLIAKRMDRCLAFRRKGMRERKGA